MTNANIQRILPVSDTALLVEYEHLDAVLAHFAALESTVLQGVEELIPAASTILVRFDPWNTTPQDLARQIRAVDSIRQDGSILEPVTIDVLYTGEDIAEVAKSLHVSVDELIRRHTEAHWSGAFAGFAPGFVYCVGDDPLFDVPRRNSPRTRIPAGSVAVASNFSAIYPSESPGGWQLIGRSAQRMWDLDRDNPAAIQPGQQVRYQAVREATRLTEKPSSEQKTLETSTLEGSIEIIRPSAQTLLQDIGRSGFMGLGVSASGAADRQALRMANRAVGNSPETAAIEIAGGGAEFLVNARTVIALSGAIGPLNVTSTRQENVLMLPGQPVPIEVGDRVQIGAFTDGFRAYLAVRGGFALAPTLTSLATDTLSGVGPSALTQGDKLPLNDDAVAQLIQPLEQAMADLVRPDCGPTTTGVSSEGQWARDVVELDIVLGPRTDWFTSDSIANLEAQTWTVTPQSDRVGLRLSGSRPLERSITAELPSEGAVTGAIQVPPNGQPVLFLPDHPLTGGYPIIGSVVDRDLDRAGQLAPGTRVRFRVTQPFSEY